jgi:hypothetical protein
MKSIKSAFKRMIGTQAEDGQAIVLIALFMVVMLAMVGVAIDGGGLFLLWRDAQNAADTAALQAAYDRCTTDDETTWQGVGYKAADINGFDDTDDGDEIGSDFSIDNDVTVEETFKDGTGYVHVTIQADKPAYFIQLVYRGPLRVKAEAWVYCSGAVDFSDLPGMIGLGPCSCSGNSDWNNSVDSSGANFTMVGDVHSNCGLGLNSGGGQHDNTLDGDASSVDGVDTNSNTTIEGGTDPAADEIQMPATIPIDLYFPGGEIYQEILTTQGVNYAHYEPGDKTFSGNDLMEGLWAVEGDVKIASNSNGNYGERGFTVVAHGDIDFANTTSGTNVANPCLVNWCYYGYNVENTDDPGVTVRWSRGNGSAIVMYTDLDSTPGCNASDIGIRLGGNGADDGDFDMEGLIYAPTSVVMSNSAGIGAHGPVIAYRISFSGSDLLWVHEPSYLQPMAPVMNNAQ